MKIFFIVVAVIVVLMLLFGRRAWDTMNENEKREVNSLYSGGLYTDEELAEMNNKTQIKKLKKEKELEPIFDDGEITGWYEDDKE